MIPCKVAQLKIIDGKNTLSELFSALLVYGTPGTIIELECVENEKSSFFSFVMLRPEEKMIPVEKGESP